MEISLPPDRLARIQELLKTWFPRKKANKRQILSLVSTLQHLTKVVRPGRSFVSRMCSTAAKLGEMYYITWLNKAFRSDLFWWHNFLQFWNDLSILQHPSILSHPDFVPKQMLLGHGVVQHTGISVATVAMATRMVCDWDDS